MINHIFALEIVTDAFAFISKNTKYCKNFDFKQFYSFRGIYFYLPNKILQSGIIYFISCLIIPIIIQKIINKFKHIFFKIFDINILI